MSELIRILENAARHAGEIMKSADLDQMRIDTKAGHGNFATEYDSKVQAYLMDALTKALPEANFLGEEDGQGEFKEEYKQGLLIVADPIDGTSNFAAGLRPSVTSIGILKDGVPYAGVIYNPYSDQMFSAERGCGAYENGVRIQSSERPLSQSLVMMGTAPYYQDLCDHAFRMAKDYLPRCIDVRRSGSAAWDLCMVASGHVGLFFEPLLQLYDFAAGAVIAEEAGCKITQLDGSEISYTGPSSVLCASQGVMKEEYLPVE